LYQRPAAHLGAGLEAGHDLGGVFARALALDAVKQRLRRRRKEARIELNLVVEAERHRESLARRVPIFGAIAAHQADVHPGLRQ